MNEPKNPYAEISKEELLHILKDNVRKLTFVRTASFILNFAIFIAMTKQGLTEAGFLILSGVLLIHSFAFIHTMKNLLQTNNQVREALEQYIE